MLTDIHGNPDPKGPDNWITGYLLKKHLGTHTETLNQTQADKGTPTHIHMHRHPRTQAWT